MTRLFAYITVLLAFALSGQVSAQSVSGDSLARSRAVDYYYMQAWSHMELEEFDRCYEMLEHCLALDSSSTAVQFDIASFYLILDKDSLTHEILKRLVAGDPSNEAYTDALVTYYTQVGDMDAAIEVYEGMLSTAADKSDIYIALFSLYSDKLEHEKAVDMLERLEKAEGKSDEISLQKLRQYMLMSDSVRTMELISELIMENDGDSRYVTLLGDTYFLYGNTQKAEEYYQQVLSETPDDAVALASLAELYGYTKSDSLYCNTVERLLKSEKLDTEQRITKLVEYILYKERVDTAYAMGLFAEMLELPFDRLEILEAYAQYLLYRDAPAETLVPVLENILSLEPENSAAILQLLSYAIEENNYSEVIRLCDNAMMFMPEMLPLYYYKGLCCYFEERPQEAIEVYRLGLARRGDDAESDMLSLVYALLGDTYHELGMVEESREAYDSALVYDPLNINVLNNYAYYLALENGNLEKALEMSGKTVAAEPENTIYIDTYAWILFLLERYEEAKAYADKLLSLGGDISAVVYHHCGDIYAKCGNIDRAVECWQKASDAGDESKILKKKIRKRKYYRNGRR